MVSKSSTGTSTVVKPKQWALIIHLRKTFSLIGAVLSDPRVHWIRKTLFLGTIAALIAFSTCGRLSVRTPTCPSTRVRIVSKAMVTSIGIGHLSLANDCVPHPAWQRV